MNAKIETPAGKKYCPVHGQGGPYVSQGRFDENPLTSDGRHTVCKSCTTAKETAFRIARAERLLRRVGLHPASPITMAVGPEPSK